MDLLARAVQEAWWLASNHRCRLFDKKHTVRAPRFRQIDLESYRVRRQVSNSFINTRRHVIDQEMPLAVAHGGKRFLSPEIYPYTGDILRGGAVEYLARKMRGKPSGCPCSQYQKFAICLRCALAPLAEAGVPLLITWAAIRFH